MTEHKFQPQQSSGDSQRYEHFHPEDDTPGRDRFGNRIATSSDLSFVDRSGTEVRSSMLISPDGQNFIRQHKGILKRIDQAIKAFNQDERLQSQEVGDGIKIEKINEGAQSNVYLLSIGEEQFILKSMKPESSIVFEDGDVRQAYLNEMLQLQEMREVIGAKLAELGFALPEYLFASSSVSCVQYIQGEHPKSSELKDSLPKLGDLIGEFLESQDNPLWQNVIPDLLSLTPIRIKTENFIKEPESGQIFLIDPFMSSDEQTVQALRTRFKGQIFEMMVSMAL